MKTENMSFAEALIAMDEGQYCTRDGWNGKNMFVFKVPPCTKHHFELPDIFKKASYKGIKLRKQTPIAVDYKVAFQGFFCMKDAQDRFILGWLASQTDMLANDWRVL